MQQSFSHGSAEEVKQLDLFAQFNIESRRVRQCSFSEVSELILHDLTNPLAVVKFCVEQLETNPQLIVQKPQYLEKIKTNIDRAFSIIDSFREVVRQDPNGGGHCRIDSCHRAATKLQMFYDVNKRQTLIFEFDPSLDGMTVSIPHFETVFILDTIYQILLTGVSAHQKVILKITKDSMNEGFVTIRVDALSDAPMCWDSPELSPSILYNFRAINAQIAKFEGKIEILNKSLTQTTGTNILIRLPLRNAGQQGRDL
jgi:hypothetical protein